MATRVRNRRQMVCSLSEYEWSLVRAHLPMGVSESEFMKQAIFAFLKIRRPPRGATIDTEEFDEELNGL